MQADVVDPRQRVLYSALALPPPIPPSPPPPMPPHFLSDDTVTDVLSYLWIGSFVFVWCFVHKARHEHRLRTQRRRDEATRANLSVVSANSNVGTTPQGVVLTEAQPAAPYPVVEAIPVTPVGTAVQGYPAQHHPAGSPYPTSGQPAAYPAEYPAQAAAYPMAQATVVTATPLPNV